MAKFDRPREYPGSQSLDTDGPLRYPVDSDLWRKPLDAPFPSSFTPDPSGRPSDNEGDPFTDYPPPVPIVLLALDDFESYFDLSYVDGLADTSLPSTVTWSSAWFSRRNFFGIQALEDWEDYVDLASANGLGLPGQGFSGLWVARSLYYGIMGLDDFELYEDLETCNGKNHSIGLGPMVARSMTGGLVAYDEFDNPPNTTYGEFDQMDGLNEGTGWTGPWTGQVGAQPILTPRYIVVAVPPVDMRATLIQNSELSRALPMGSNWQKIRIALRLAIRNGGNMAGTPRFAIGVCSGTSNRFLHAATANWVGLVSNYATWFHAASPDRYVTPEFYAGVKISSGLTVGAGIVASVCPLVGVFDDTGVALANRQFLFVDITKGSPNFTINTPLYNAQPHAMQLDMSAIDLAVYEEIEYPVTPVLDHIGGTARMVAVDEGANGALDTLTLAWTGASNWEISDIDIVQFA